MDIKYFENQMKIDLEEIFSGIIKNLDGNLKLRAKARAGAEISDILEDEFVKYFANNIHPRIYNPGSAPKGATKNPYDIKFNYKFNECDELIWGDIKAFSSKYENSNPDLGTVNKVIKFMLGGHFYIVFILVEYSPTEDDLIRFESIGKDNSKVKIEFLKDIHHSFRVNPKNQLQVNYKEEYSYRTKADFIKILEEKYIRSYKWRLENAKKKLDFAQIIFDKIRKKQNI